MTPDPKPFALCALMALVAAVVGALLSQYAVAVVLAAVAFLLGGGTATSHAVREYDRRQARFEPQSEYRPRHLQD